MSNLNNNIPLVSISCITYNHVDFIKQALNGFLIQKTSFNFEVLIHDDASTDGTEQIIREYETKFPEIIKPIYEKTNQWVKGKRGSAVFNFPRAKGKYIALCEGDDYWTDPLKLQKQVDFLENNPSYGICFHNVNLYSQKENKLVKDNLTRIVPETTSSIDLAKGNFIHTPSVMMTNNFTVPGWYLKSPLGDWSLYMIVSNNKKIKKLDDIMAVYRVHEKGIWSTQAEEYRILNTIKSFNLLINSKEFSNEINKVLKSTVKKFELRLPKKKSFISRILYNLKLRLLF